MRLNSPLNVLWLNSNSSVLSFSTAAAGRLRYFLGKHLARRNGSLSEKLFFFPSKWISIQGNTFPQKELPNKSHDSQKMCVCVRVCVWEREREGEEEGLDFTRLRIVSYFHKPFGSWMRIKILTKPLHRLVLCKFCMMLPMPCLAALSP